jgi:xanthine dehydrogenase YagS FAD-binding subunit
MAGNICRRGAYPNIVSAIAESPDSRRRLNPDGMAVALTALNSRVVIASPRPQQERVITIGVFYRRPGDTPHVENELKPGELITAVDIPVPPANSRSHYLQVRDGGPVRCGARQLYPWRAAAR